MVFNRDGEKTTAVLDIDGKRETYNAVVEGCKHPTCSCETAHIRLSPLDADKDADVVVVPFDVYKKTLDYPEPDEVPEERKKLAETLVKSMTDEDIETVRTLFLEFKRRLTETADLDSLDVTFPVDQIERESLMVCFSEIFPYAETPSISVDGRTYLFDDQYCLQTKCGCTHAILTPLRIGKKGKTKDFPAFLVDYKTRKWEKMENRLPNRQSVPLDFFKEQLLKAYPAFYSDLKRKHGILKKLYAKHKRSLGPSPNVSPAKSTKKPGRNDPCPCGSGKKYKKCCMKA